MNSKQVRDLIVKPACEILGMYSIEAERLLMGTWAHESAGGRYIAQVGGPALGAFQMEPDTLKDLYINFLAYKPDLHRHMDEHSGSSGINPKDLYLKPLYAAMACRLHYWRVSDPIPTDWEGIANYWKTYYNTYQGKGTVTKFMFDKDRYLKGLYDGN